MCWEMNDVFVEKLSGPGRGKVLTHKARTVRMWISLATSLGTPLVVQGKLLNNVNTVCTLLNTTHVLWDHGALSLITERIYKISLQSTKLKNIFVLQFENISKM